jgi:hypothetical protein
MWEDSVMRHVEMMVALAVGGAIAASLFTIALAQSVRVGDDWVLLHSLTGGFHVLMPPDWEEDSPGNADTSLSFRPSKSNAARASNFINCKAQAGSNPAIATSTQASLDAAVAASPAPSSATRELLSTLGTGAAIRENGLIQVSNHPAYFIVVSGSHETSDTDIHAVAAEVILVRPGWVYSLACTAGARSADQAELAWTTWRPVFMAIMSTFDSDNH